MPLKLNLLNPSAHLETSLSEVHDQGMFTCLFTSKHFLSRGSSDPLGCIINGRSMNIAIVTKSAISLLIHFLSGCRPLNESMHQAKCVQNLSLLSSHLSPRPHSSSIFKVPIYKIKIDHRFFPQNKRTNINVGRNHIRQAEG